MELRTVLFATDGSVESEVVCRAACDIARATGANLHLLHAWKMDTLTGAAPSFPGIPTPQEELERKAHELAESEVQRAKNYLQRDVAVHVRHQTPIPAIHALALQLNADLVVVGGHVTGTLERLFTSGSVSEAVLEHVGRPTLILHGDDCWWPPSDIVACNDGSDEANMATVLGAAISKVLKLGFHVVEVMPTAAAKQREELQKHLQERVRELLEGEGVGPLSTEIIFGRPRKSLEVIALDEPQTLLALGTRGRGAVPGVHIGSTAFHLLRASVGPVLVVPKAALHRAVSVAQLAHAAQHNE